MMYRFLKKVGRYDIFIRIVYGKETYMVDNGKTIYSKRFKKTIRNPYRDVKKFSTLNESISYIKTKTTKKKTMSKKVVRESPKSLYLILLKEESTSKTFVKVGFTSKRFIVRRFSKSYGYSGYTIESILRRIDIVDAEKFEKLIKDELNKKRSIKKYRPILESFSGYTECYDFGSLNEITKIFDEITKNC